MSDEEGFDVELTIRWTISEETGIPVRESLLLADGKTLHCDHRPAYREFNPETGNVTFEQWFNFGDCERPDIGRPCETRWDSLGRQIISEVYRKAGKLHRDHHRPAKIHYSDYNGNILREEFWVNGVLHRGFNLPAIVDYDEIKGTITHAEYYVRGKKVALRSWSPGSP